MKRIEAEDPGRRLAGLEHSLKGKDRLTQKINEAVDERGHTVDQAFAMVKDAIRYTFHEHAEHSLRQSKCHQRLFMDIAHLYD
jgi:hypothetical protein